MRCICIVQEKWLKNNPDMTYKDLEEGLAAQEEKEMIEDFRERLAYNTGEVCYFPILPLSNFVVSICRQLKV